MDKNTIKLGFALTNPGLIEDTEAYVKKEYPSWDEEQVNIEMKERLKKATLFNDINKRVRKRKGSGGGNQNGGNK